MSDLDNKTKPIAVPLMTGVGAHLNTADMSLLARWCVMKFLIIEQSPRMPVLTSQDERAAFMNGTTGKEWNLWIAKQNSTSRVRSFVRHAYPSDHEALKPLSFKVSNKLLNETQFFVWRLGKLVVVGTYSKNIPIKFKESTAIVLRQLLPSVGTILWPPLKSISQADLTFLERDASAFFLI